VGTLYGHGSWVALAIFFGLFALRALSSQRRRQGRQGSAPVASSFNDPASPAQAAHAVDESSGKVTFTGVEPCWLTDPSGRHEKRYWSGSEWTEHVSDAGVPGIDPPPANTGRESSS
jgi:hypothetical protein